VLATVVIWLGRQSISALDHHWQRYRVPDYLFFYVDGPWQAGLLLQGLGVTFKIVVFSLILAAKHPGRFSLPLQDTFTKEPIGFALQKGDVGSLNFFNNWIRMVGGRRLAQGTPRILVWQP
jgi:hypothetical protein